MHPKLLSRGWLLCLLALVVGWSASVQADGSRLSRKPTPLSPLPGDSDSFALGINNRGWIVGHSSSADDGTGAISTAVVWDRDGAPTALLPLVGDDESFAVAINASGQVVGHSRNNSGICRRDTAVMWLPDGTSKALPPLGDGEQSVANAISDDGLVAGTSKGVRDNPEVSCNSLFTPLFWDSEGMPVALSPLEGFPEGYATTVTSNGDVIGGSVNVSTGFDFQGTVWRRRRHNTRPLRGPANSFLNTPLNANADGVVVGDSFDFSFTMTAVIWDVEGQARLLPPLRRNTESSGRAVNMHGRVAGRSTSAGMSTATVWSRNGKPASLRPLSGDTQSDALAINRSGQVAGRSFGAGVSTAVTWRTR